jgi:hypothetical protein
MTLTERRGSERIHVEFLPGLRTGDRTSSQALKAGEVLLEHLGHELGEELVGVMDLARDGCSYTVERVVHSPFESWLRTVTMYPASLSSRSPDSTDSRPSGPAFAIASAFTFHVSGLSRR